LRRAKKVTASAQLPSLGGDLCAIFSYKSLIPALMVSLYFFFLKLISTRTKQRQIGFWIAIGLTLLTLANAGIVFHSLYNGNPGHPASLLILNLSFNVLLHIGFVGG
jgi:hypothetical protein